MTTPNGSLPQEQPAERAPTIVLTFCWSFGIPGGVGRHLQELARALGQAGAKVLLVTVKTARYSRFPRPKLPAHLLGLEVERELVEEGVEAIRVEPHPVHWMYDAGRIRDAVARLLDERSVDAVLSFYHESAHLPDLCARHGVPWGIVATWQSYAHERDVEYGRPGLGGKLRQWLFERNIVRTHRRAQLVFANSEFTVGELRDVLGVDVSNARVTYLGVDPSFSEVPREERDGVHNLLFFGRIFEEKGIFDGVRALARLNARGRTDWTLRVAGTGEKPQLEALAAELGLTDQVEILEHQGDQGLRAQLAWADLALLPSHSESFGLAIAEANCAGLPVIGFHAGSVPEVVEDGSTAWLAPLGDLEALTDALQAALDDPDEARRRGLAGRERVLRLFRWERTAKTILEGIADLRANAY